MSAKATSAERRARVEDLVKRSRAVIERQRLLLDDIRRSGANPTDAEAVLESFEELLLKFEDDLAAIEADDA